MPDINFELLEALLSPEGTERRTAETALAGFTLEQRCEGFMSILQHAQTNNNVSQEKSFVMAAILLRRDIVLLSNKRNLMGLAISLSVIFKATTSGYKKYVGDCLAEILASLQWIDLPAGTSTLGTILDAFAELVCHGDIGVIIFLTRLAERAKKVFVEGLCPRLPKILSLAFPKLENNPDNVVLLLGLTLEASGACNDSSFDANCLLPILRYFILQPQSGSWATNVIELLLNVAEENPLSLVEHDEVCTTTIQICLQVMKASPNDISLQLNAIQVISSITQVDVVKHRLVMNGKQNELLTSPTFDDSVLVTCLRALRNGVDDDYNAWANDAANLNEDGMGWDADADSQYAELLLKQLITNFQASAVKLILPVVEKWLQSPNENWKSQRAALATLQCCVEGAPVSFSPYVATAMDTALRLSSSPNPRIQYQAIMLLGILCDTAQYESAIRNEAAARLLQVFACASQSACTKVASIACQCIVSYCRPGGKESEDPENWILPFLPDIIAALISGPLSKDLVGVGNAVTMSRAIGAIACLAEATGEMFAPFYRPVMTKLLTLAQLQTCGNFETMYLAGVALETSSIICQSLKDHTELFLGDAKVILRWIVPMLNQDSASIPLDQVLAACARIASVLVVEYAPYAETVIGYLIRRCRNVDDIEFSEVDAGEIDSVGKVQSHNDDDLNIQTMTVAVPGRGLSRVTINTTKIQEKTQAIRALYEHVVALEASFEPYLVECFESILPLIALRFSSDVRVAAVQTVAAALSVSLNLEGNHSSSAKYLPIAAQLISKQLTEEGESMDTLFPMIESLSEIFRNCYYADVDPRDHLLKSLDLVHIGSVVRVCMDLMKDCLQRRNQLASILLGEESSLLGVDEIEEYESNLQKEQEVLTPLVDTVGYLLKMTKQQFIPLFKSLIAPILAPYLQLSIDTRARVAAVCLFDDVVEHCSPAGADTYSSYLLGAAMLGINDATNGQDIDLKSASIYGIAQIARKAPPSVLLPHANTILRQLAAITNVRKEEVESLRIYENAVSCLASLLLFDTAAIPVPDHEKKIFLKTFLESLPLSHDPDEAKLCHAGLCDMIEHGKIDMTSTCEIIVRIIGEIFVMVDDGEDIASEETCTRLEAILIRVKDADHSGFVQNSFASLSVKGREAVDAFLENNWNQHTSVVSI